MAHTRRREGRARRYERAYVTPTIFAAACCLRYSCFDAAIIDDAAPLLRCR